MKRLFRRASAAPDEADEPFAPVSADLPYELQSKMLDQLTTVSVAGVGLAITLIGSLLRGASHDVWLSVAFFGLAAITAVSGNIRLIEGTFQQRAVLRRSKRDVSLVMTFIGVAVGFLSMSIYDAASKADGAVTAVEATGQG
ncbi:hypothetical protein V5740_11875 [Croceibacterium sp. TMG7-5b_MA50]|uniref:hypothetical protein n=1 Tax=Croceibacterium sp. TMG7-5b_MA50 TaxID=3121290 RepID=UPI00322195BC